MYRLNSILEPLKRISPSRYTAISRCPYKVVLANSYSSPLLPYSPANHLGNVIHECIKLVYAYEIDTIIQFNERWNRLIAREENKLKDIGFGFLTPLRENVIGYTTKKLRVKSMLNSRGKPSTQKHRKTDTRILTEKWLESQDSLIGGFADMIINSNGYTKLFDFKSGKILTEKGEVKEEYGDQLRLYAYLHNEVYGKYPDELSIIDLQKNEYSLPFTPQECEILAGKSREALLEINSLIEKDDHKALARPDIDHCKSCLYRPACNFYWDLPLSNIDSMFRDLRGNVLEVRQFRNGNLNVTLYKDGRELMVSHINSEYLSYLSETIGKEIAFYNVMQGEKPERYQAIKTTTVYEV